MIDSQPRPARRWGRVALTYLSLFVVCGAVFGLVTGVTSDSVRRGLTGGTVFGLFMAVVLGSLIVIGQRGNTGSWSPRQRLEIVVPADPTVVRHQVLAAFAQLQARLVRDEASHVVARSGMSWKTWGTRLDATFDAAADGTRVQMRVRPRVPTTVIDYGAAHRAVDVIRFHLTPNPAD